MVLNTSGTRLSRSSSESTKRHTKARPKFVSEPVQLKAWARNARRGEWCCYWYGNLHRDRECPSTLLTAEAAWALVLRAEALGREAWSLYLRRHVTLVQKREWNGTFYFAVKL